MSLLKQWAFSHLDPICNSDQDACRPFEKIYTFYRYLPSIYAVLEGATLGAPKYMEWYSAFGLLITLIWLYIEILRLLAKSRKK